MENLVQAILFAGVAACFASTVIGAEVTPVSKPAFSCSDMEDFLLHAHPGTMHSLAVGVTNSNRLTLESSGLRHDAHVQTIDERKTKFEGSNGGVELNFRDSYKYKIAYGCPAASLTWCLPMLRDESPPIRGQCHGG